MIDVERARQQGISRRIQLQAERVAKQFPILLKKRNLKPAIAGFALTRISGLSILAVRLNMPELRESNPYTRDELLSDFSMSLGGLPIYISKSQSLRYVILLSPLPKLPRKVVLPGDIPAGKVALGLNFSYRPILKSWKNMHHIAVLGNTGSGKSVFLRSLVHQAIRNDMKLLLADIDQVTFSMWEDHPNLFAPIANTPADALELIQKALGECDQRANLYLSTPGHPENLAEYNRFAIKRGEKPLPRMLVVLDEASAVLSVMGGGKGVLGQALATLGWRGRKFGIHFVFGAQEFTKDLVGAVREQVGLAVSFRVRSEAMAKRMGCAGASRIPEGRPGLAITDRFGPLQTYFVEKSTLLSRGRVIPSLSALERNLFRRALAEGGKLPASKVQEWAGMSAWQSRRILNNWATRGWVAKDAQRDNAFCVTEKLQKELLFTSNPQSPQSGENRLNLT